ncbi:MAG: type II toxin-antitoxin system Phd/YefM family antitoxin [Terriglobales bacterium]
MEQIPISKFKATCLAVLENVRKSGHSVLVTRYGRPVAEISPPRPARAPRREAGRMAHTARIVGDIVGPVTDEADWDALR